MEIVLQPWPWYVAGPMIALVMLILIKLGKSFGMSSNLRTLCAIGGAGKVSEFFKFDWKASIWGLVLVAGVIVGGYIAFEFLNAEPPNIHEDVVVQLNNLGIESVNQSYLPLEIFSLESISTVKGFLIILIAGFLVGFGTRYAGGCTSGHAISGLSNLQLPSLIAVVGFFIGGLVMVHFILPLIF